MKPRSAAISIRNKFIKRIKIGRHCEVNITHHNSPRWPYEMISYDGGFKVSRHATMAEARKVAASEARRLRRSRGCRR